MLSFFNDLLNHAENFYDVESTNTITSYYSIKIEINDRETPLDIIVNIMNELTKDYNADASMTDPVTKDIELLFNERHYIFDNDEQTIISFIVCSYTKKYIKYNLDNDLVVRASITTK